jgi:hypothetical protein
MKIIVQIITHNQSDSIEPMIESTKDFERLWVVDRCLDNSIEILKNHNENFIENIDGDGFLAGKMRDIGLDYILSKDYDYVVMLDGDRIPTGLTKDLVLSEMENYDCSIGMCKEDFRRNRYEFRKGILCITAGLIVKSSLLRKIRNFSFMSGRCFHEIFDGEYGEEDIFFGDCMNMAGAKLKEDSFLISGKLPSTNHSFPSERNIINMLKLKNKLGLYNGDYFHLKQAMQLEL